MAIYLSQKIPEGKIHDTLYDELVWLKKQLKYYQAVNDLSALTPYFDEVSSHFHSQKKLQKKTTKRLESNENEG